MTNDSINNTYSVLENISFEIYKIENKVAEIYNNGRLSKLCIKDELS